jgi:hypothetical protein
LGRVAGVLSGKMGKVGKGKAAAGSGETWYEKKCREDPNFKAERAEAARKARQAAAADRAAAAPAAAAAAPAATAEANTATSPGFLERTMPSVFGRTALAAAQRQPAPGGAPVSGGYTTAAALDGLRYPSGSSPSEVDYHAPEWAGLERAHQLLGVQLLEPGLLREEQLTRAAERLRRGEAPFNVDEWAQSSAAFLVYGDFGPLETADGESLWGRRVIDDNFRFVGINELAGRAGSAEMPALMRSATSLLQQTLPGAYGVCADDETALIDDEAFNVEAHEALESAVQALGYYTCAVKEARKSLMPAEPLLQLIEKLEVAQARVNELTAKTIEAARAAAAAPHAAAAPRAAAAPPAAPAAPARAARSPSNGRTPDAPAAASPAASGSRSTRSSPAASDKALGKRKARK